MSDLKFGSKTINSWTSQESQAPYVKAILSTGAVVNPSRAVINKGTSTDVNLTIGGEVISVHLIKGQVYKISATKSSSNSVIFLY
tara:strand:+ start:197 stop:451 length:255 start_codon:yes stop_codon:yes gene_type:complete